MVSLAATRNTPVFAQLAQLAARALPVKRHLSSDLESNGDARSALGCRSHLKHIVKAPRLVFSCRILRCRRIFTHDDVQAFVKLTGDANPIHTSAAAAQAAGAVSDIHTVLVSDSLGRVAGLLATNTWQMACCLLMCRFQSTPGAWYNACIPVPCSGWVMAPWSSVCNPNTVIPCSSRGRWQS